MATSVPDPWSCPGSSAGSSVEYSINSPATIPLETSGDTESRAKESVTGAPNPETLSSPADSVPDTWGSSVGTGTSSAAPVTGGSVDDGSASIGSDGVSAPTELLGASAVWSAEGSVAVSGGAAVDGVVSSGFWLTTRLSSSTCGFSEETGGPDGSAGSTWSAGLTGSDGADGSTSAVGDGGGPDGSSGSAEAGGSAGSTIGSIKADGGSDGPAGATGSEDSEGSADPVSAGAAESDVSDGPATASEGVSAGAMGSAGGEGTAASAGALESDAAGTVESEGAPDSTGAAESELPDGFAGSALESEGDPWAAVASESAGCSGSFMGSMVITSIPPAGRYAADRGLLLGG